MCEPDHVVSGISVVLKKKANWISDGNYLLSEFFLKILGRSPGGIRQGRSGEWCNGAPQDDITLPRTSPRRWHTVGSSPVMPPTWRQKSAPPLVMLKWGVSLLCCLLFWTCKRVWCQQPDVSRLVLRLNWALRPSKVVPKDFVISLPKVMKFGRGPFWKKKTSPAHVCTLASFFHEGRSPNFITQEQRNYSVFLTRILTENEVLRATSASLSQPAG